MDARSGLSNFLNLSSSRCQPSRLPRDFEPPALNNPFLQVILETGVDIPKERMDARSGLSNSKNNLGLDGIGQVLIPFYRSFLSNVVDVTKEAKKQSTRS